MTVRILTGHVLDRLADIADESIHCCITSPPYFGLRSYSTEPQVWGGEEGCEHEWTDGPRGRSGRFDVGNKRENLNIVSGTQAVEYHNLGAFCLRCNAWRGELGQENSVALYVAHLVDVFAAVKRVLRKDGVLFVNLGDSYAATHQGKMTGGNINDVGQAHRENVAVRRVHAIPPGLKPKDLLLVPDRFRIAMQGDGWWVRSKLPWLKRSCMPESVGGSRYAQHQITVKAWERLTGTPYVVPDGEHTPNRVDCPGCPKCEANGGLVLSMSAGRPTSAVEDVILFTKSGTYFWDAEAVRRAASIHSDFGAIRPRVEDQTRTPPPSTLGQRQKARLGNGSVGDASGRHYRTSDMFFDSLGPLLGAADEPEPTPQPKPRKTDKQGDSGLRRYAGFNDRWDASGKEEANAGPPFPPQGLILDEDGDPLALDVNTAGFNGWTKTERRVRVRPDDADGDTIRIATPDCPVHAGLPDPAPTGDRGGRKAASPSLHNPGSGDHPAPMPLFDSVPIDRPGVPNSAHGSSDSPLLSCSPSATDRSTGSRRTGRGPATSLACTPSAQSPDHTGDTSASPVASDSVDRTPESSSEPVDSADRPSAQTTSRTADTSSCTCSFFKTVTESISHFATFPPKLVRPLILAGTSEKGCCRNCGSPWVRVVEKGPSHYAQLGKTGRDVVERPDHQPGNAGNIRMPNGTTPSIRGAGSKTTGWLPSCQCPDPGPPIPCRVLDCFGGSGTTGKVADDLGRDSILIDLQSDYVDMASDRITAAGPMFADVEVVT